MIYTSYFAQMRNFPKNCIPVSICGKAPEWYTGIQYKKVAPKRSFFKEWKENHNNDFYIEHFNKEVLDTLDRVQVLNDLQLLVPYEIREQEQTPIWFDKDHHLILLCYEKPNDFCHRHLVANWLNQAGTLNIEEWSK